MRATRTFQPKKMKQAAFVNGFISLIITTVYINVMFTYNSKLIN